MSQDWETLYREYRDDALKKQTEKLWEAVGTTVVFLVGGGVCGGLLGWSTVGGFLMMIGGMGVLGCLQIANGTFAGMILDGLMLTFLAVAGLANIKNLLGSGGGIVVLLLGGAYAAYLAFKIAAYRRFATSSIEIGKFADASLPLMPDTGAFLHFIEKGRPAAILLRPHGFLELSTHASWKRVTLRCSACGKAWAEGAQECASCRNGVVAVLHLGG